LLVTSSDAPAVTECAPKVGVKQYIMYATGDSSSMCFAPTSCHVLQAASQGLTMVNSESAGAATVHASVQIY
jgi:hypothetical protein